jgi:6-pyruvoyltetrahydropterin/6-carboxytetrahydropterin synthase
MYCIAVQREFDAQHYLIGGDWGAENLPHTHYYRFELKLTGAELNQQGFLVDIVEVERQLDALIAQYKGQLLNNMPGFEGLNPSIEHFCRIACQKLAEQIPARNIHTMTVRLWEHANAWASYQMER